MSLEVELRAGATPSLCGLCRDRSTRRPHTHPFAGTGPQTATSVHVLTGQVERGLSLMELSPPTHSSHSLAPTPPIPLLGCSRALAWGSLDWLRSTSLGLFRA